MRRGTWRDEDMRKHNAIDWIRSWRIQKQETHNRIKKVSEN